MLICFTEPVTDHIGIISARRATKTEHISKARTKTKRENGLHAEYRFDYTKSKPNRFATRIQPGAVAVLLDPDVARVFKSAETVNDVLRAVAAAMPRRGAQASR